MTKKNKFPTVYFDDGLDINKLKIALNKFAKACNVSIEIEINAFEDGAVVIIDKSMWTSVSIMMKTTVMLASMKWQSAINAR